MSHSCRVVASFFVSAVVGAFLFYNAIDIAVFVAERTYTPAFSRSLREILVHIFLAVIFSVPIAALAQRNSAFFGALAVIVGDLLMFFNWFLASSPRGNFGMSYFVVSGLYAVFFALCSHTWWTYAFKRHVGSSAG
ncbi:hypothetical protein [Uliginosibacterium sp. TH139]|uniref:hypothetical protein n=1 Tax=Uliginosibacterium sp. TH139 TaxID=2067453 RepID=UPI0011814282|nr:hypothetical protein [Uliginosibacterium sp. TH139]